MSHVSFFESDRAQPESALSEHISKQRGITPPQTLAQDAAAGKRGAAWRLLQLAIENDPPAIKAIASCTDPHLIQHFVEFLALGTWAGKPFVKPAPGSRGCTSRPLPDGRGQSRRRQGPPNRPEVRAGYCRCGQREKAAHVLSAAPSPAQPEKEIPGSD